MHNGLQYATLAILLFGILLNRYDVSALRKDIEARFDKLDVKIERVRDEFLRRNDPIVSM